MTVIRKADSFQSAKEFAMKVDVIEQMMHLQASSCTGECNDCDNCGGSITH